MRFNKGVWTAVAIGSLLASAVAYAGYRSVWSTAVNTSFGWAYGQIGDSRNAAYPYDQVGCWVQAYPGSAPNGYCIAEMSGGSGNPAVIGNCSTADPGMIALMESIKGDSFVEFEWNTGTGVCTYLFVSNNSQYTPKQP